MFKPGDVLTFQLPDGTHGLTVVADVTQYRRECDYMLCRTTYNAVERPNLESVGKVGFVGSFVPTGGGRFSPELMEKTQNLTAAEMESGAMARLMAEITSNMPKLKMSWVMVTQHKIVMRRSMLVIWRNSVAFHYDARSTPYVCNCPKAFRSQYCHYL